MKCGKCGRPLKQGKFCRGHNPKPKKPLNAHARVQWTRQWLNGIYGEGRHMVDRGEHMTQQQIALLYGVSNQAIEQVLYSAINKFTLRLVGFIIEDIERVKGVCTLEDIADALRLRDNPLPFYTGGGE